MQKDFFLENGWVKFSRDQKLLSWVEQTLPTARKLISDPANHSWLRCGGTWFAGVNLLSNDSQGRVGHGPKLQGKAIDFIKNELNHSQICWDAGQLSICYPGYPKPMESESESAFRFRKFRDAAHVDGLLPEGKNRRRHLREFHSFILGIPMVQTSPKASPLVVWQGSHKVIRNVFNRVFTGMPASSWGNIDVTDIYQSTRREIFDRCQRIEIYAEPGQAYLVHRLALHGVAPWHKRARATNEGRMISYFRPEIDTPNEWLSAA